MDLYKGMAVSRMENYPGRPTIVFLHDSLGCTAIWRDFPAKLGELTQCNLLVYDRPGYGLSEPMASADRTVKYMEEEADLLAVMLVTMDIRETILFGHSDGGSIALIAAAKHPARIRGVICEAAHIFVEELTLQGIREAKKAYEHTDLPQRLTKYHGNKVDTLFRAWVGTWLRPDFRNWNIESFLPAIQCPLLFIQGEGDEYGTLAQVSQTLAQVAGPSFSLIIPGAGHTPHKEAPEPVLAKAKEFTERIFPKPK